MISATTTLKPIKLKDQTAKTLLGNTKLKSKSKTETVVIPQVFQMKAKFNSLSIITNTGYGLEDAETEIRNFTLISEM